MRLPASFSRRVSFRLPSRITATREGLFTGYYEIELNGSRQRHGRYQTPLYRKPPDLGPEPPTRAEIEDGALAGRGLELLWVDDPIDAFFLQIQGSGRVRLNGGGTVRVGYDGQNGHPYVPVGRLLIERGVIPRDKLTMAAIRVWMKRASRGRSRAAPREPVLCVLSGDQGRWTDRRRRGRADAQSGALRSIAPSSLSASRSGSKRMSGSPRPTGASSGRRAGYRGRDQGPGARRCLLGHRQMRRAAAPAS